MAKRLLTLAVALFMAMAAFPAAAAPVTAGTTTPTTEEQPETEPTAEEIEFSRWVTVYTNETRRREGRGTVELD